MPYLIDIILIPFIQTADPVNAELAKWGALIRTILNTVVAIFAIVGGFLVFFQYMQGNDQAQKNFIKFIIGLAIVGLINLIVKFFLPNATTF